MGSTHATLPSEAVLTPMHPSKRGWKMGGSILTWNLAQNLEKMMLQVSAKSLVESED